MKTKERILVTSLSLFNELGEPNVTTVDVSNEMEISPGNLYYHYRNKDDIIEHIVTAYDQDISRILNVETAMENFVEHWLFLKLICEKNWQYRFIFRDFENLASKYKNVARKLARIRNKIVSCMFDLITVLATSQNTIARFPHQEAQAENMAFILTRTLVHEGTQHSDETPQELLSHTCFQTLLILWPFLSEENQGLLTELSMSY